MCISKNACNISTAGGRCFQYVDLKPFTEYKLSASLKLISNNSVSISGIALLGAFDSSEQTINSGREPTNRLNISSTNMIQLSEIEEEFKTFSVTFNSENNKNAIVGVFYDPRGVKGTLFATDFKLEECNGDNNLIKDPCFSSGDTAWEFVASSVAQCDN